MNGRTQPELRCCIVPEHHFFDICDPQDVWCTTPHLGKGARCALPLHPSGYGSSRVLNPFQSQQTVSPVKHSRETSLSLHPSIPSGRSWTIAPLNPLAGLGEVPLHLHRTMHERLAVRSPIRDAFELPRYPHEDFIQTTSWRPTFSSLDTPVENFVSRTTASAVHPSTC